MRYSVMRLLVGNRRSTTLMVIGQNSLARQNLMAGRYIRRTKTGIINVRNVQGDRMVRYGRVGRSKRIARIIARVLFSPLMFILGLVIIPIMWIEEDDYEFPNLWESAKMYFTGE